MDRETHANARAAQSNFRSVHANTRPSHPDARVSNANIEFPFLEPALLHSKPKITGKIGGPMAVKWSSGLRR
jgi:hypothetical protein